MKRLKPNPGRHDGTRGRSDRSVKVRWIAAGSADWFALIPGQHHDRWIDRSLIKQTQKSLWGRPPLAGLPPPAAMSPHLRLPPHVSHRRLRSRPRNRMLMKPGWYPRYHTPRGPVAGLHPLEINKPPLRGRAMKLPAPIASHCETRAVRTRPRYPRLQPSRRTAFSSVTSSS